MSEWLSTGQMIDLLQVGQIAEGNTFWEVKKLEDGKIIELNSGDTFGLDKSFLNEKWTLLPLPLTITFEEAMGSLKEGKTVRLHLEAANKPPVTVFRDWFKLETREGIVFKDLFEGRWTIEN